MFILILNVWKKLMLATVLDNHAGKLSSQAYIMKQLSFTTQLKVSF